MKITKKGWKGKLQVAQPTAGGWMVAFDAQAPDGWWIYDTVVMTAEQIRAWTGSAPGPKR